MAARAMWKGVIELGQQPVPVKLYAAARDSDVHFHLLHEKDQVRVEQRIVNAETGKAVAKEEIRKGYELRPGTYVILEPDELESVQPKPSREIEIERFIPADALAPAWFERPYYLGPDGGVEEYYALTEALAERGRQAIVRWAMRGKRYTGALRADTGRLVLLTLRDRDEVIEAPRFKIAASRAPSAAELALAEQLIGALQGEFDPAEFHNEYREQVRELVERKANGETIHLVKPRARKQTDRSLEAVLKASVKASGKHATHRTRAKERASA